VRALIASRITVGVNAIAMRDHFGGSEFWWGVWVLCKRAPETICIHHAAQRKLMSGLDRLLVLTNRELVARRLVAFLFDGIRKRKLVYAGIATRLLGMLEV
jgi:hypothetical protein